MKQKRILLISFVMYQTTAAINSAAFEQEWKLMQQEYNSMYSSPTTSELANLEELYCHSHWINSKKKLRELILSKPDKHFLENPVIRGTMVRTGTDVGQQYEICFLKQCTNKSTRNLLGNFVDTNFGRHSSSVECIDFNCSTNTLGHLFYAARVLDIVEKAKIKTIVEFGAGYGNLARIFKSIIPDATIILIDLPELLAIQHLFLRSTLPEAEVVVHTQAPINYQKSAIHLVPVFFLQNIQAKADLFISNFALSESPEVVQSLVAADKRFFESNLTYITGQLKGWGPQYNFAQQETIFDGIKQQYETVRCQPFHLFLANLQSYEIMGYNVCR